MKSKGQNTTEYGICIALLSVLALGSLTVLGGNIRMLLSAAASGKVNTQTDQLFSLIGASTKGVNTVPSSTNTSNVINMQLQIDPTTGQVVTIDTTGGAKNTTSVPGDQAMAMLAQQMQQLSNVRLANGQPLPSNIQQQIMKLMADGQSLSSAYGSTAALTGQFNAINAANAGKTSGLEQYPSTITTALGKNLGQGLQFQQDYTTLNNLLTGLAKTDPSVTTNLIQPINQLAGGISSIQYNNLAKNFADNINANAMPTSAMISIYTQNPALQQTVPPSTMMQTFMLPPAQMASSVQGLIATAAQNAVVGTPPTAGSPVDLSMTTPITATP